MKRFGLTVLILGLALSGCAQNKGKSRQEPAQASRLDNLEDNFTRFQEQQRARDADIDSKLREIASRLDRLGTGQPPVSKASRGKERKAPPAASAHLPIVAGQVIPYSSLSAPAQPQPAPSQHAPAQAAPGRPQPLAPPPPAAQPLAPPPPAAQPLAPQPAPVTSQALSPRPAAPAQPQGLPALQPPVVTLGDSSPTVQPVAPAQPKQPQPLEPSRPAKGRASAHTPQALAPQAAPAPGVPAPAPVAPAPVAPAPSAAAPAPSSAAAAAPDIQEQLLYTEALRAVSANRNDEGRKKFNDFLAKYPSSAKTPEALYWIGESYMGDKSYNQAILAFKEVANRFPKDSKAAEALYRTADAYERLGDKANAAFQLKLLVDGHPNSEVAGKAKQKLKQLGQ